MFKMIGRMLCRIVILIVAIGFGLLETHIAWYASGVLLENSINAEEQNRLYRELTQ